MMFECRQMLPVRKLASHVQHWDAWRFAAKAMNSPRIRTPPNMLHTLYFGSVISASLIFASTSLDANGSHRRP